MHEFMALDLMKVRRDEVERAAERAHLEREARPRRRRSYLPWK